MSPAGFSELDGGSLPGPARRLRRVRWRSPTRRTEAPGPTPLESPRPRSGAPRRCLPPAQPRKGVRPTDGQWKVRSAPFHFQNIAQWGPCGKTRVVPQNRPPRPEFCRNGTHKMRALLSTCEPRGAVEPLVGHAVWLRGLGAEVRVRADQIRVRARGGPDRRNPRTGDRHGRHDPHRRGSGGHGLAARPGSPGKAARDRRARTGNARLGEPRRPEPAAATGSTSGGAPSWPPGLGADTRHAMDASDSDRN